MKSIVVLILRTQSELEASQSQLNRTQQDLEQKNDNQRALTNSLISGSGGILGYLASKFKQAQATQNQNHFRQDPTNSPCSRGDCQTTKQQRDNYQQQVQTIYQEKENKEHIICQINQELNLGLDNPNLNQIISKIKELIHKPPTSSFMTSPPSNQTIKKQLQDAQQTIVKLEQELAEKNTPFGEDLAVIKQLELESLEQLFNQTVDSAIKQQITQATSYQQVVSARQAFIQKHLEQKQNVQSLPVISQTQKELIPQPNQERIILIGLLALTKKFGKKAKGNKKSVKSTAKTSKTSLNGKA
ncbi:17236_t:CDS:2 [Entrophospora sp. SA101]|nr:17236_t:CDS:2 [Entrophospora sp. SA101]